MIKSPYTLITGASCGIGKAMAIECAKRGFPLILVALPDKTLQQTTDLIRTKYDIPVHPFAIDLTKTDACKKIVSWIKTQNLSVNILINNAGIGSSGEFESFSPDFFKKQIYLNSAVPTVLTRLLLGELKRHPEAFVLNVASLGGYFNLPDKNVYSASKSFIISFSRSLGYELKRSNVHVSALCPGPVNTNARVTEMNKDLGWISKKLILSPERVAHIAIKRMLKKRRVIIPGLLNKVLLGLSKLTPPEIKRKLIANERNQTSASTSSSPDAIEKTNMEAIRVTKEQVN